MNWLIFIKTKGVINILAQGLGFVENEAKSSSMKQEAITLTQQS
jgi:hypothetical protein